VDQTIASGHQYLGYATFLLVVGSVVWAWTRSRAGAPYQDGFPRIVGLILAAQVLFGLLTYGAVQGWDYRAAVAYVHPVVMIAAVGLGGVATARARDAEGDAASWMAIARFHGLALLAVLVGIGVASA
jgi:hypothetical protein